MLKNAMRVSALVAALALLGAVLAGCGHHGPTLPSPDAGGPIVPPTKGAEGATDPVGTTGPFGDPTDPSTLITNATQGQFTVCEELANGGAADVGDALDCGRPIICFKNNTKTGRAADISIVLDKSGSMAAEVSPGVSRMEASKDAAKLLVSLMKANDRAEVVSFDTTVTVVQGFTSDKTALETAINGLSAGGGTNAWDGGKQGLDDLISNGRPGVPKAVILLTDGISSGDVTSLDDLIAAAKAASIPIYTIGLGAGVDAVSLQKLADETGGEFIQTTDQNTLRAAFQKIFKSVTTGNYDLCWKSAFKPGTKTHVVIYYKKGTAAEQKVFDGKVIVKKEGTF